MDAREQRGLIIAATCRLNRLPDGTWLVPSQSATGRGTNAAYRVNLEAKTCTCPDHTEGGHICKHYYAAAIAFKRDVLPEGTVIETKTLTKDSNDCPHFVPLIRETRRHFEIGEVSADKAYASVDNFEEMPSAAARLTSPSSRTRPARLGALLRSCFTTLASTKRSTRRITTSEATSKAPSQRSSGSSAITS